MNIQSGFYYHIKDTFFAEVQDSALMANLRLHKHGIPLFYTDIDRIYHLMEEKLKS